MTVGAQLTGDQDMIADRPPIGDVHRAGRAWLTGDACSIDAREEIGE